jgi:hypothetical protein
VKGMEVPREGQHQGMLRSSRPSDQHLGLDRPEADDSWNGDLRDARHVSAEHMSLIVARVSGPIHRWKVQIKVKRV